MFTYYKMLKTFYNLKYIPSLIHKIVLNLNKHIFLNCSSHSYLILVIYINVTIINCPVGLLMDQALIRLSFSNTINKIHSIKIDLKYSNIACRI